MKNRFIRYTGRETLLYKIVDSMIFDIQKTLCRIKYLFRNRYLFIDKLHLGCGGVYLKNFINTDVIGRCQSYIDITKKMPLPNQSVNTIYSNHLIEHIYLKEAIYHLNECYRVLKKNGTLIISTPDMRKIIKTFDERNIELEFQHDEFTLENLYTECCDVKFHPSLYINEMSHILFGHKFLYDFEYLKHRLQEAGFTDIKQVGNRETGITQIDELPFDEAMDSITTTIVAKKNDNEII